MTDQEIEAAAKAIHEHRTKTTWDLCCDNWKELARAEAKVALEAVEIVRADQLREAAHGFTQRDIDAMHRSMSR